MFYVEKWVIQVPFAVGFNFIGTTLLPREFSVLLFVQCPLICRLHFWNISLRNGFAF